MYDAETVTTTVDERRPATSPTLRFAKLRRVAARRLTRAHLALADRPQIGSAALEALDQVAAGLSTDLGCEVRLEARLNDVSVSPFGGLSRFSAFALVELAPLGAIAAVEFDLATLGAVLNRVAGTEGKPGLPLRLARIEEAAFGWVCLLALEAVRKNAPTQKRFAPRLLSVSGDRGDALERLDCRQKHLAIDIRARVGDVTGQLRLLVPALPVQASVQDTPAEFPSTVAPEVLATTVSTRVFVGYSILGADDLEGLSTGDVVLFDGVRRTEQGLAGRARLQTPCFELYGDFSSQGFEFTRAQTRALTKEQLMPSNDAETAMPALPIELEIELTRIRIPVSQLATLRPGAVLPLHVNSSEPVTLRIGERAVARAELVDIDGEVGARIINLVK